METNETYEMLKSLSNCGDNKATGLLEEFWKAREWGDRDIAECKAISYLKELGVWLKD